jgi:UDP-N-acetylglucosamine--N-acetylmuramyl-(pentapeptide) pyrophosphoryl-undecaprenol N-acetylglucosamine transferase
MQQTICFVGGKSGGHIVPCLTLAQHYKNNNIVFFSTDAALDQSLLHNNSAITQHIALPVGSIRTTRLYHYPLMVWRIFKSFYTSLYYLYRYKPSKVISTGGLVGLPVCFAAKLLRIPIELYELNATPGKAAHIIAPLAQTVHVCFKHAAQYFPKNKCMVSEYPVRFIHHISKEEACKKLKLNQTKKTIFIVGGSQGSLFLNKTIKNFVDNKKTDDIQIIHQTGIHDKTNWEQWYKQKNIPAHAFTYTTTIDDCYAASDLIISRAGAGTLFEIKFFDKKSIIIPLETKQTNHQYDNAQAMAAQYPHLFTLIRQNEIEENKAILFDTIHKKLI